MNQFQMYKQIINCLLLWTLISISTIMSRSTQVKYLTPKNMKNMMGCMIQDPIACRTSQDWILLFFDSNNHRQCSTFEYLIPSFNKQIRFAQQNQDNENTGKSSNTKIWEYPSSVVIDCYSSPSLCRSISPEDLPLVIYKNNQNDLIRYQGYVTLSGLISFIKTHDPSTSFLASYFKSTGERKYSKLEDFSQKQINAIFQKLKYNENTEKQQQTIKRVQPIQQNKRRQYSQLLDDSNSTLQGQPIQRVKEEAFSHQVIINRDIDSSVDDLTAQNKQIQLENGNVQKSEIIDKQIKGARKSQKEKKSKKNSKKLSNKYKQKQIQKEQSQTFDKIVQFFTQFVVSFFKEFGISGYVLQVISQVAHKFFTIFFGIIYFIFKVASAL